MREPPIVSTEQEFPSTLYELRKVRIRRPAGGQKPVSPKGMPLHRLPPRPIRESLTVSISYKGGAMTWWEVKARGAVLYRPGYVTLDDLMVDINRGWHGA